MSDFRIDIRVEPWGRADDLKSRSCPVCALPWRPWFGSYLPCHAQCLLTESAQDRLLGEIGTTLSAQARRLGVSLSVVRSSHRAAKARMRERQRPPKVRKRQRVGQCTGVRADGRRCEFNGRRCLVAGEEVFRCGNHGGPSTGRKRRRPGRSDTDAPPRAKVQRRITKEDLRIGAELYPIVDIPRPKTRADCAGIARPCPWVACKHNLYLDVNPQTGSIKVNFPHLEPRDMLESCALDVADRGGVTLEEVGEHLNLTRERIRQLEVRALLKLKMGSTEELEDMAA